MTLRNLRVVYIFLTLGLLAGWSGCSSPSSRISRNQSEFNVYPADVQAKIRKGEVDIGFTAAQVTMALGKPSRIATRTTAAGSAEVWIYDVASSGVGFGLGLGMATGGSSAVGAGVGTNSGGDEENMRVVFTAGRVSAVERVKK